MNVNSINVLVLAYLGDAVYELYIRKNLIYSKINKVKNLQSEAIKYVCAKEQANILDILIKNSFFNDNEIDIIKRARNSKVASHPKNVDILTYKHATALEAIIGYLYITDNIDRLEQIIDYILKEK